MKSKVVLIIAVVSLLLASLILAGCQTSSPDEGCPISEYDFPPVQFADDE